MSERTSLAQADAVSDGTKVDMTMWTELMTRLGHKSDSERAKALKMHHSVISRLRSDEEKTGRAFAGSKFIAQTCALGIPYWIVFGGQP